MKPSESEIRSMIRVAQAVQREMDERDAAEYSSTAMDLVFPEDARTGCGCSDEGELFLPEEYLPLPK